MYKISIGSFSYHGLIADGRMDIFGYLESCKYRYQLDTADIWNGLMGKDPEQYLQPEFLKKVRDGLDERELTVANYHADGCHVWEDDPAARERHYKLALRHLQAAEVLGARTMRIDSGGRQQQWTSEQFDEIARRYREYAKRAGDHGYRVGPETHWGAELVLDNMLKLAKAVDNKAYGILLHLGHHELVESVEKGDQMLAPYAMHTHVDARTTATRLEPAIRILIDAGYTGYIGVEHHTGKNEYAEVAWQVAEVRRVLQRLRLADTSKAGATRNPLLAPGIEK
jgi:sugar phosphate isomerase/epimerase